MAEAQQSSPSPLLAFGPQRGPTGQAARALSPSRGPVPLALTSLPPLCDRRPRPSAPLADSLGPRVSVALLLPLAVCEQDSAESSMRIQPLEKPRFSYLLRETNPYKASSSAPCLVFPTHAAYTCPSRRVLDLAEPASFPIANRAPRSLSGRINPLGELATLPSFLRYDSFAPGCTRAQERGAPVSFLRPAMAPPRRSPTSMASLPPAARWVDRNRQIEDQQLITEENGSLTFMLKRPWEIRVLNPRSKAHWRFCVFPVSKRILVG